MAVRYETLMMLKEGGLSPVEISKRRGVSLKTTLGYLDQMVGDARLRRSDILFSIPAAKRRAIAEVVTASGGDAACEIHKELLARGVKNISEDEVKVVLWYGDAASALGDMYEDLRAIETGLHRLIRESLEHEFGQGEGGWWRKGIPAEIRKTCAARREDDEEPADEPYCYTDLIDPKKILHKRWPVVSTHLLRKTAGNKKALLNDLNRLNHIRRMVMHPVRGGVPSEQDFEFLRDLKRRLGFEETSA